MNIPDKEYINTQNHKKTKGKGHSGKKMKKFDITWDDNPVDITSEANFIWGIGNHFIVTIKCM